MVSIHSFSCQYNLLYNASCSLICSKVIFSGDVEVIIYYNRYLCFTKTISVISVAVELLLLLAPLLNNLLAISFGGVVFDEDEGSLAGSSSRLLLPCLALSDGKKVVVGSGCVSSSSSSSLSLVA